MRSRTIEVKRAKAGDFQRNRLNPKTHDTTQLDILGELLDKFGVVGGIIVYRSERNNNEWTLFDGHGRQELNPDVEYDVTYTDLTDQDVDKLSMMYDRIAARATPDAEVEAELLKDIDLDGHLLLFARDIAEEDDISVELLAGLTDFELEEDLNQVQFQEYDEGVENTVEMITCPLCHGEFPK